MGGKLGKELQANKPVTFLRVIQALKKYNHENEIYNSRFVFYDDCRRSQCAAYQSENWLPGWH
jgi:hypothetical protein